MNLSELLDNAKEIQIPPVAERAGAIISYRRILITVVRDIRREAERTAIPALKAQRLAGDALMIDRESWFDLMRGVAAISVDRAIDRMRGLLLEESGSHLTRLSRSVFTSTGIDVAPVLNLSAAEEERLVQLYVERNASLIRSLSDDTVNRVEQAVYNARLNRQTYKDLTETLQRQFGMMKNRADLIAYDQLASLNSDFTQSRHNALGITQYRWRTRADGRVRPLHKSIENSGKLFTWGRPTDAEGGLPPGKNVRCRCTSVAVLPANPASVARQERLRRELTQSNTRATQRSISQRARNRRLANV